MSAFKSTARLLLQHYCMTPTVGMCSSFLAASLPNSYTVQQILFKFPSNIIYYYLFILAQGCYVYPLCILLLLVAWNVFCSLQRAIEHPQANIFPIFSLQQASRSWLRRWRYLISQVFSFTGIPLGEVLT